MIRKVDRDDLLQAMLRSYLTSDIACLLMPRRRYDGGAFS